MQPSLCTRYFRGRVVACLYCLFVCGVSEVQCLCHVVAVVLGCHRLPRECGADNRCQQAHAGRVWRKVLVLPLPLLREVGQPGAHPHVRAVLPPLVHLRVRARVLSVERLPRCVCGRAMLEVSAVFHRPHVPFDCAGPCMTRTAQRAYAMTRLGRWAPLPSPPCASGFSCEPRPFSPLLICRPHCSTCWCGIIWRTACMTKRTS